MVAILISHPAIYGQTLSGTVTDAQTEQPLDGATIVQQGTGHGTTTDASGAFKLELLDEAAPIVEIRYIGYRSQQIEVNRDTEVQIQLTPEAVIGEDVLVRAFIADSETPVTFTNVDREAIREQNLGQDIPFLLEMSPSVVSTSDAGAGIGYTGMRIRGIDSQRINVTINGIPLNDAESHGVFWVNMPDFASSLENIQIQRGTGTSAHGPAAFGATVNLQTAAPEARPYGELNSSAGSFNTFKSNIRAGTGLMENGWALDGRLSYITSDGYIDRASADLRSFFASATRHSDESLLKVNVFSGREQTYHAWYGIHEDQLEEDRRFNPAGMYTDPDGNTRFYEDQTDNYTQTHYQLHYSREFSEEWSGNIALHYTRGRGFFEEFRNGDVLSFYNMGPVEVEGEQIDQTDLVRRRHLDNHFYGTTYSGDYSGRESLELTFGGGWNRYDGDHFGEVIWARIYGDHEPSNRYYDNTGIKTDRNVYAKATVHLSGSLRFLGDFQVRDITYTLDGVDNDQSLLDQEHRYTFFNPKTGLTFDSGEHSRWYVYYGMAGKEPVRRDFTDADPGMVPGPETLYDLELGYRGDFGRFIVGANGYLMRYDDQLINTGEINENGAPVRTNVPESYRSGVELEAAVHFHPQLQWSGNLTFSRNRIPEFTEYVDQYNEQWEFIGQQENIHENTPISFSPAVVGASNFSGEIAGVQIDWNSRYTGRQYLDNTGNPNRSLDPWWVNDLNFSYDWAGLPFTDEVSLRVMVNNFLDYRYESNGYTFGYILGEEHIQQNFYFPQAGRHVLGGITARF